MRWLADAAGFPATGGGTFVSGGSIANLSALVAARGGGPEAPAAASCRRRLGALVHGRRRAHHGLRAGHGARGRRARAPGRAPLEQALAPLDPTEVVAVVATAGATNTGAFDDLVGVADVCAAHGLRLHVDGAYGGAALLSPSTRPLLAGIERADSFIVDPHKMLYSHVRLRRAGLPRLRERRCGALTQTADYLEPSATATSRNPSDLAIHLTRRRAACRSGRRSWPTAPTPTPRPWTTAWTSPRTPPDASRRRRHSRR